MPTNVLKQTDRLYTLFKYPNQTTRVWTHSLDPIECADEGCGGEEIPSEFVVAGGDAPPVLDTTEEVFNFVPIVNENLPKAAPAARVKFDQHKWLLSVGAGERAQGRLTET